MSDLLTKRETCRLCGGTSLSQVLHLEPTPPANAFVNAQERMTEQAVFPLDVYFCGACHHVQLLDIVNPVILFENYVYVSGTSPSFVRHFEAYSSVLIEQYAFAQGSLVVEIGSNDGTMLEMFQRRGLKVLGIDPAKKIAAEANAKGIPTWIGFFDQSVVNEVIQTHSKASLVVANNVFAHADNLKQIAQSIKNLLTDDGVFVFEVSYLLDVLDNTLFDTIYHEHLSYHSVAPLRRFFSSLGLELFRLERISTHGGSIRCHVQKSGGPRQSDGSVEQAISEECARGLDDAQTFIRFEADIDRKRTELMALLHDLKKKGKTIAGYGAPAKATTLCHHFKLGADVLDYIIDDSPLKQNLYSPGYHIPVVSSAVLSDSPPDYLIILAWNFAEPIMNNQKNFTSNGGHFIVPLPEIKVY